MICGPTKGVPSFKHNGNVFDIMKYKSKDYYCLIISNKAQLPNNAHKLKQEFELSEGDLELVYALPHTVALEPYVKAFQYKVLNSILYTNTKLYKIGYTEQDKCTFCNTEPETLHHFFFHCLHSNLFWKDCEQFAFSITKQNKVLNLQDIIIGSIDSSSCPLLNYLILIGKLRVNLWDCRRKLSLPCIEGSSLSLRSNTKQKNTFILRTITYRHFITQMDEEFSFLS